jgi:DNA-binding XRE family transcriptional regulator
MGNECDANRLERASGAESGFIRSMTSPNPWIHPEIQAELDAMGAHIRRVRIAGDATQRELEDVAWLDQTTISRIENGLMPRLPMYKYARLLAAAEGRLGPIPKHPKRQRYQSDRDWS